MPLKSLRTELAPDAGSVRLVPRSAAMKASTKDMSKERRMNASNALYCSCHCCPARVAEHHSGCIGHRRRRLQTDNYSRNCRSGLLHCSTCARKRPPEREHSADGSTTQWAAYNVAQCCRGLGYCECSSNQSLGGTKPVGAHSPAAVHRECLDAQSFDYSQRNRGIDAAL